MEISKFILNIVCLRHIKIDRKRTEMASRLRIRPVYENCHFNLNSKQFSFMRRELVYPLFICCLYSIWLGYMTYTDSWHFFTELWEMPLTMALGSFVAGCTPTGGSAVAFPVFTKILNISSEDARTFGLMIQAIGMTSASLFIWHRRIKVLWNVVIYASIGGLFGTWFSENYIYLPAPYPKLLFTTMISIFAVALIYSYLLDKFNLNTSIDRFSFLRRGEFIAVGFLGGIIANTVGSGIDIMVFMTLALCYRISEKVSIPTTIICMAINSIIGFLVHATSEKDIQAVWEYWIVSVPVVAIGAPLGAFLMTCWSRTQILVFVVILISIDFVSSIMVFKFTDGVLQTLLLFLLGCISVFALMIRRGNKMFNSTSSAQQY